MRYFVLVVSILLAVSFFSMGKETLFLASNDRPNSKIIYTSLETGGPLTKLKGYLIPKTMLFSPFGSDECIIAGQDTLESVDILTWLERDSSATTKSIVYLNSDTVQFILCFQPLLHPASEINILKDSITVHFSDPLDFVDRDWGYTPQIDSLFQSKNLLGAYRLIESAKSADKNYSYKRDDWEKWVFPNFSTEYINVGKGVNERQREERLQHGIDFIDMAKEDKTKDESYMRSLENLITIGDSILFYRCVNEMGIEYRALVDSAIALYRHFGWESIYESPLLNIFVDHYINTGNTTQLIEFADVKDPSYSNKIYSGVLGRCDILDFFLETGNYQTLIDLTERYMADIIKGREDVPQNIAYYYAVSSHLLGYYAEVEKITADLLKQYENESFKQIQSNLFDMGHTKSNLMYLNAASNLHLGNFDKSEKMLRKIESLRAKDVLGISLGEKCGLSRLYQAIDIDTAAYRLAIDVAKDCKSWVYHQLTDTLISGMLQNDNSVFSLRHSNFDEYINLPIEIGINSEGLELLRLVYDNICISKKFIPDIENNFLKYFSINDSLNNIECENIVNILNRINTLDRAGIKSSQEIVLLQGELREAKNRIFRRFIRENSQPIAIPDYFQETISGLKPNDMAVEFVPVKGFNQDQTEYIALFLQSNDTVPHVARLCNGDDLLYLSYDDVSYLDNIYNLIWTPMLQYLEDVDTLYFSTSGLLNQLPIENALCLNNNIKPFRLTSTHNLTERKQRVYGNLSYVIYGDLDYDETNDDFFQTELSRFPSSLRGGRSLRGNKDRLRWARAEIDSISSSISKTNNICKVFDKQIGTEASVYLLNCDSVNVLHFTTHGFFYDSDDLCDEEKARLPFMLFDNDGQPSYVEDKSMTRSGLLLSGANKTLSGKTIAKYDPMSDGILTAQEISTLSFANLDQVVLSACETGLGKNSSDGVYGLQRGFRNAGAKSILMSLWEVDDFATSVFMNQYYKNILSNVSKEESLRIAQSYLRNYSEKYNHPFYWAGWILLDALD